MPMAYSGNGPTAVGMSGDSSRTTHGAAEAVDACRYFGGMITSALSGASKDQILAGDSGDPTGGVANLDLDSLSPNIREIAEGSFKVRQPPEIVGSGYVVRSLEAALWAFHSTENFESGCLAAVNLGDDADTTAAVYGQIAGAYYGASGIPERWLEKLHANDEIKGLADGLHELSQEIAGSRP